MIDRPMVFSHDVPAVMINRGQLTRLADFLFSRRVPFESRPFQQSFELIRFPTLSTDDVETLLDQMARTQAA